MLVSEVFYYSMISQKHGTRKYSKKMKYKSSNYSENYSQNSSTLVRYADSIFLGSTDSTTIGKCTDKLDLGFTQ